MNQRRTDKFFNLPDFWKFLAVLAGVVLSTVSVNSFSIGHESIQQLEQRVVVLQANVNNYIKSHEELEKAQSEKIEIQLNHITETLKEIKDNLNK